MVNQPTYFLKTDVNFENELALFDLLKQGDETAFEKIYKRYWAELYNAAYKRLPEKEKCQDLIQNIFTDLWTRRSDLTIDNPTAYLHTAVRFQVIKHIARNPRASFFTDNLEAELISPLATDGHVLEKEVKHLVELYIAALPEKRKHIFLMHYYDGLSTANIAIQLKVSRKTVQNQLNTASHALRLKLTHMLLFALVLLLFS